MKKEEFEALVKSLDRLGLGNGRNADHRLQPTRTGALLMSVLATPLC